MNQRILLVVDAQGDFCRFRGKLYVPGAEHCLPRINAFLRKLVPGRYKYVVFTYDTHQAEGWAETEEGKLYPLHCEEGTPGWHLAVDAAAVSPAIPLYMLAKNVFDMWADDEAMVQTYSGVTGSIPDYCVPRDDFFNRDPSFIEFDVIGFATDVCVRDAVKGLIERGFRVRVYESMVAGINKTLDQVHAEDWGGSPLVTIVRA